MNNNLSTFKKRLVYNPLRGTRRRSGIALIMAMTALMFLVYIASEVTRDSAVEYIVNSQELNRIKSYYAARNGMQIALLRIKIFQQASSLQLPAGFSSQLDQIWQFPFAWPLPIPPELNTVDKGTMEQLAADSLLNDVSYTHTIEDEGSKIDLNDLTSPSKKLRDMTKQQLLNVFEQKMTNDNDFRREYQSTRFDDLVNNIVDWTSDSATSASGRSDKRAEFTSLGANYPPNRGFRTIAELRLVPGMTETFYNLLEPRVTIYGMKAINPNTASYDVLLSLDAGMTDEAIKEAVERRTNADLGGPFTGEGDACRTSFREFVESRGARLSQEFNQIPMVCDKVFNFRIKSTGIYGSGKFALQNTITAVVMDINQAAQQIKTSVTKEKEESGEAAPPPSGDSASTGPSSAGAKQEPLPKGPPRVVYWTEN
ncbi:general secretion pathway protein GspK [Pseudobdellovibrio exovorus]|uniref:General secretory pathway protein K n=1 Tax=Pseudobdellovibrio exovorus JSS TaxID=1184267 RepID=M4VRD5_9BACT|nr:type II secretion system protein GspK [Pseudobdellovibrio exovorus]AGH95744.1 general secretory pathway protein K [Pseudobdellovibrio exovorus JSS]